ncbi:MAG: DUF61 family protein [Dehalococcoidales bacterium]|nr:MAG: DUF61 family protein [Dehalococcoidales bacterium]
MVDNGRYDRLLQESIKDELRVLNSQLPARQKSLDELMKEDTPSIALNDGSIHLFKKKELKYLSDITNLSLWNNLFLPVIIEVIPGEDKYSIICRGEVEEKVFSAILGMPVTERHHRIVIYKPQLALLRKILKTTTQYLFSPKILP